MKKISFHMSLSGRMLLFAILPIVVVLTSILVYLAINSFAEIRNNAEKELEQLAVEVAKEVEIGNTRAVLAAQLMAFAQESALFGHRAKSSEYARRVLHEFPEFTGAYIGYEPNADRSDAGFLASIGNSRLRKSMDAKGRFIPYWFRDQKDNNKLLLTPLVDMETSLYYQGVRDLFKKEGKATPMVTEPYVYEGKMIVEQTYPILRNGKFVGIAGVDRALDDLDTFLHRIKKRESVDLFMISRAGRFIAVTRHEDELKTKAIKDTIYEPVLGDFYKNNNKQSLSLASDPFIKTSQYFVSAPIPTGEWMIILSRSEKLVVGPIQADYLRMGLLAGAGILFVLLLTMWFARTTARRIKRAMSAADKLAAGDLAVELPRDDSGDELSQMYISFNHVLDSYRKINDVVGAIAHGDFSQRLEKRSDKDTLTEAINSMAIRRRQAEEEMARAQTLAEETTQAKGDFLANMSHEIRTPMNAIIGLGHLIMNTDLSSKQHDYMSKINTSASTLLGIINDILDFSKIEAGKLDIEAINFNLNDVLENVTNMIAVKAGEKGIEFMIALPHDLPVALVGDPLRLGQVLINLANNAVKFTDEGNITVSIEALEKTNDDVKLRFSITDTGIGMTEQQTQKLFQAFSQADGSTTRKYGGTGLGLSISKGLVERMQGEIGVDSVAGEGSTFYFTAEFGLNHKITQKQLIVPGDLFGMRTLIVDDNASSREILADLMKAFQFEVAEVSSGEEAIQEINNADKKKPFELVLMDWNMPNGMDGLSASRSIKSNKSLKKIPAIIMVSAYGREELVEKAREIGIEGYLVKPVVQSMLFDSIMATFDHKDKDITISSRIGVTPKVAEHVRGARILLVEDNEINQQVAQELLEQAGLFVTVADDGQKAIDILNNQDPFDGVLMDLQMPVMGGIEATKVIRKSGKFKNLPIIAMTANAMAGDREKCIQAGMNDHVAKPINVKELFDALDSWVKTSNTTNKSGIDNNGDTQKSGQDEIEIPQIEGIDIQDGIRRVGGSRKLYRNILIKFRNSQENSVDEIKKAIKLEDFDLANRIAHTLKGVAGNISANDLQAKVIELETVLKTNQIKDIESLCAQTEVELKRVIKGLAVLQDKSNLEAGKENKVDIKALTPLFSELKTLLEQDDTKALSVLESIRKHSTGIQSVMNLRAVEKAMEAYDFEEALEIFNSEFVKVDKSFKESSS